MAPNGTATTVAMRVAKKVIILDEDSKLTVTVKDFYPVWFYIVLTVGITFCTCSCAIWFLCAINRLRKEKTCNHPVYTATIVVDENGEKGVSTEKAKHSKKVEALSEAESLAKSFKSIRSKRSSKRSEKSAKSSKKPSAERGSKEPVEKPSAEKPDEKPEDRPEDMPEGVRPEGGRDVVIQMDDAPQKPTSYFRAITGGLFFSESN